MFFAKKLISAFLLPTTFALLAVAVGLGLLWWNEKRQRLGKLLVTGGFLILLFGTSSFVSDAFVEPLEFEHPPLYPRVELDAAMARAGARPRYIVVLGGGEIGDRRVPAIDQLNESALARLTEGIRLLRELPGCKLLLSGGVGGKIRHADRLAGAAASLGVKADEMELDRTAWDTEEEARNIGAKLGTEPFFLVTSAFHMPRAVALFRKAGTKPIPAPTHHLTLDVPGVVFREFFPAPEAMGNLQSAWHEYLGMIWSKLRGRI